MQLANAHFFPLKQLYKDFDFNLYTIKHEMQILTTECTKFYIRKNNLQSNQAFQELQVIIYKSLELFKRRDNIIETIYLDQSFQNEQTYICLQFSKGFDEKSGFDYYQLVKLLCGDFPRDLIISALQLYGIQDDDNLYKTQLQLKEFSKALLFTIIFDDFLIEIQDQIKISNSLEQLIPIIRRFYPNNDDQIFSPCQTSVFECLLKFSPERFKPAQYLILPYTNEMLTVQFLKDGFVDYSTFVVDLYKNIKVDQQLTKLLSQFDKSTQRITEINRIISQDEELKKKIKK
ncbi:hypothetical protein pb186bvf_006071 [Paramecium bursaria]